MSPRRGPDQKARSMSFYPLSLRRRRSAAVGLTALGSVLAVLLSACSGTSSGSAAAASDANAVLKWATTFPTDWDPVVNGAGAQFRPLALVYASVTNVNAQGNPTPGLASSWTYNKTGTEVTFHIRPGLKFTDGTPVNAAAIKDAIVRAKTQQNSALVEDLEPVQSVTTSGDNNVEVYLNHPDYQIPLVFGERVLLVASPKAAEDPVKLNEDPVGAGPFEVVKIIPGQEAILKKNPGYWDAKDIHISEVELFNAPSQATVVAGLKTGVYNFADLDPSEATAAKAAGLDVFVQPGYNAENISININMAPFKGNPTLVEAMRYAINRQQFVNQLTFGYGEATDEVFPPGAPGYNKADADLWPYNPTKAKQLLAQAGYKAGQVHLDLVISSSTDTAEAEIVQSQLGAIGIDVSITVNPNWATPFFAKQLAFSLYGTTGRDSQTETLRDHFGPDGVLNLSSPYEVAGFEAAVDKAEATPIGSPDYEKNLQAATAAGLQSLALIFVYSSPNLFAKSKSISALPGNPGHVDFTGVTINGQ
jgi:peptide/nickel transport system substrate-binding protein